ncbi:MAG: hypothetical protein K6F83_08640 [Clostridiales bacterium]|nr:hypothetical protein [Clostridiales bacterium]
MKKLIAVSLSLVMVAGVMAGCNSEAAKETEETKAEETTTVEESEESEESSEETELESKDTEVTEETEANDDRIVPNKPFEPTPEPTEPVGLVKKEVVSEWYGQPDSPATKSVYEYEDGVLVKLTYDGYREDMGYEYQEVTEYEYDGDKLIKETSTFDYGQVSITDYEYDGDLLTSKIVKDSDGNLMETTIFTYDGDKLISEDNRYEDVEEDGCTSLGYRLIITHKYDEMGYEIEYVETLKDVEHIDIPKDEGFEAVGVFKYYYDEDGKLIKYIAEDNIEITYEYDDQGNEVKMLCTHLWSEGNFTTEYDKEYDEKNRIVKYYSPSDDKWVEVWTYEEDSEGRITKIVYSNPNSSETTTYYYE